MEVIKRDEKRVKYDSTKVKAAVAKAVKSVYEFSDVKVQQIATEVSAAVILKVTSSYNDTVYIEELQDIIEEVLMRQGHTEIAKAYILYRNKRAVARRGDAVSKAIIGQMESYLQDTDWKVQENANVSKSINGLNNYLREKLISTYWKDKVYPEYITNAHTTGRVHIHDLGFYGPYCCGWDCKDIILDGFGGVEGKVQTKPPKKLLSFLNQIVNSTFTTQGESAGAQAWSNLDVYAGSFIKHEGLAYKDVKDAIESFIIQLNVPTRVGGQCPFSNITLALGVPKQMQDESCIIGGVPVTMKYKDCLDEVLIFDKAYCEVMLNGDSNEMPYSFPIPTVNITKDTDWDSEAMKLIMEITSKYGIPYFANYISSGLSPDDALSMCCRLNIDLTKLRSKGGGLFGSNPHTGSIGVVTLILPRLAAESENKAEFFNKVRQYANLAKESLVIKRKEIEHKTVGLYPFSAKMLKGIKLRKGSYWVNHFSTIGILGMNEACQNLGINYMTDEGKKFAIKTLNILRDLCAKYQEETGNEFNLEATPAEGTCYNAALKDKAAQDSGFIAKPIYFRGTADSPYYTNSTQIPVDQVESIDKLLEHQKDIQPMYTGGTVQHMYFGEQVPTDVCKTIIKRTFEKTKMPYVSITPTFSICPKCGYIKGEKWKCSCGSDTQVWSRVTGFLRPVQNYNKGKTQEFKDRKTL